MWSRLAIIACVLTFVAGFSSTVCGDLLHVGEPDDTNGNPGWSSAIRLHAYYPQENHYASAVARFSFAERRLGDEFRAVVWGQKPGGQGFVASDWLELLDPSRQHLGESIGGFFIDVWDSNPAPRGFDFAQIGNVYHGRKPLIGGTLAALGGSSFYQWGTKEWGLPSHTAHFDISDITFEPGIEYWISLRVYVRDGGEDGAFGVVLSDLDSADPMAPSDYADADVVNLNSGEIAYWPGLPISQLWNGKKRFAYDLTSTAVVPEPSSLLILASLTLTAAVGLVRHAGKWDSVHPCQTRLASHVGRALAE